MSIEAMLWAKRQRLKPLGGTVAHRAILMVLADYADESGECFPGQELIAYETEQSERTVRRHLGDLEGWGLFRREPRFRTDPNSGRSMRTSDRFVLSLSVDLSVEPEVPTGQPDRRSGVTGGQVDRRSDVDVPTGQHAEVQPDTVDRGTDSEPTGEPTGNKERARPTKRTRVPEPFVISDRCKQWAQREHAGVDPRHFVTETANFVDWHAAHGTVHADWDRAWMTWMRRHAERMTMTRQVPTRHVDTGQETVRAEQRQMFEEDAG